MKQKSKTLVLMIFGIVLVMGPEKGFSRELGEDKVPPNTQRMGGEVDPSVEAEGDNNKMEKSQSIALPGKRLTQKKQNSFMDKIKATPEAEKHILDPSVANPNNNLLTADFDRDDALDIRDNCPDRFNPNQRDRDGDGVGDACDSCPDVSNSDQADFDNDNRGDACQDTDRDGVMDANDNCPTAANSDQRDRNGDGIGDACDTLDCPEPEFTLQFEAARCTYFRADTCGDFNEGSCIPGVAGDTPIVVLDSRDLLPGDGYTIRWTSHNATQLIDSCGNLLGDIRNPVSENYYSSASHRWPPAPGFGTPIMVNSTGDSRRVTFHWGSNYKIPEFESGGSSPYSFSVPRYDSFLSFTENTTRRAPSSVDDNVGVYNFKTGTLNCTVRATNACGRTRDFRYSYNCMP